MLLRAAREHCTHTHKKAKDAQHHKVQRHNRIKEDAGIGSEKPRIARLGDVVSNTTQTLTHVRVSQSWGDSGSFHALKMNSQPGR